MGCNIVVLNACYIEGRKLCEEQIEYIQSDPPPTGQKTDQVKILKLRPEKNQNQIRSITRNPEVLLQLSHLATAPTVIITSL